MATDFSICGMIVTSQMKYLAFPGKLQWAVNKPIELVKDVAIVVLGVVDGLDSTYIIGTDNSTDSPTVEIKVNSQPHAIENIVIHRGWIYGWDYTTYMRSSKVRVAAGIGTFPWRSAIVLNVKSHTHEDIYLESTSQPSGVVYRINPDGTHTTEQESINAGEMIEFDGTTPMPAAHSIPINDTFMQRMQDYKTLLP